MTSREVLIALTRNGGPFSRRQWVAVPNVYWGWGLRYEADLIAVSRAGVCTEVEIKVSRQDLRQDRLKRKWLTGLGPMIARFYYAVPENLKDYALEIIPEDCGLVAVGSGNEATSGLPVARVIRRARTRKSARKPTEAEILKLHHLGIMRFWDLMLKEVQP